MALRGVWAIGIRNLNAKPFLYLLAGFSVVVLLIAASIQGFELKSFWKTLRLIPTVATADIVAYLIFTTWIWRWKFLQGWLIPFPDLNGTWQGHLETTWKDEQGNTPGPIPTILTIKQSFTRLSCVMRTGEMVSHSYIEGFCIDKHNQVRRLCYSYTSQTGITVRHRSNPHDGTMVLNIIGTPAAKLEGEYWTRRETTGTVKLKFLCKTRLEELPDDLAAHPMTAIEQSK